jgi:hypothetical protein
MPLIEMLAEKGGFAGLRETTVRTVAGGRRLAMQSAP